MALDLRQQLSSMSAERLKELADANRIDTTWCLT